MTPKATIIPRASRNYMLRPPPRSTKILSEVSYRNVQAEKKAGYHILGVLVYDTLSLFLHLEAVSAQEIITSSSPTSYCPPPAAVPCICHQPNRTPAQHQENASKQPVQQVYLRDSQIWICTSTAAHYRAGRSCGLWEQLNLCCHMRLCNAKPQALFTPATKLSLQKTVSVCIGR